MRRSSLSAVGAAALLAALLASLAAALGCTASSPEQSASHSAPSAKTMPAAGQNIPTPTKRPTRTPTPIPTAMPPVSINPDCIGCPVVAPGAGGNQQVLDAYREWTGASKHPDPVLLVGCYRGTRIPGLGSIVGAKGAFERKTDVAVTGQFFSRSQGACYAITALYDGLQPACWETIPGGCQFGGGQSVETMTFKGIGNVTEISTSQYDTLIKYARATEYKAAE